MQNIRGSQLSMAWGKLKQGLQPKTYTMAQYSDYFTDGSVDF